MFSAILLATSCLSDDTEDNITYYDDTAITSFSLGTLNRYLVTKAKTQFNEDGTPKDSTYKVTVDGSQYKFYIDQAGRKIYNADSLPQGTDAAHVICNVGSKNAGIVVIKDVDSDTLRFYSSVDSVDFSSPREFQVYATGGTVHRSYTVSVNVHKEDPDSFRWNAVGACDDFTRMKGMKAVEFGGRLMVYASDGNATSVYATGTGDGAAWAALTTTPALDAEAWKSVVVHGNTMFTVSGGRLMVSTDGLSWQDGSMLNGDAGAPQPERLAGAGRVKLYGIDAAGDLLSSENHGVVWQKDRCLGDKAMLPQEYISMAALPLATSSDAERIIIAGSRSLAEYPEDSVAMVWNKIEEYDNGSEQHGWILCEGQGRYQLPRLSNLRVMEYGGVLVAVGGRGQGQSTAGAFAQIYVSRDNGLTWHADDRYVMPAGFTNGDSDVFTMAVDKEHFLWIICGGNGIVWRGRLNRLGWADDQTSFTE